MVGTKAKLPPMKTKLDPPLPTEIREEILEFLRTIASRGGKANSKKQQEHRRNRAVRAMMHKRFPNDKRWK